MLFLFLFCFELVTTVFLKKVTEDYVMYVIIREEFKIVENMIFVSVKFISHKISSNSASSKLDTKKRILWLCKRKTWLQ